MKKRWAVLTWVLAAVFLLACGGGGGSDHSLSSVGRVDQDGDGYSVAEGDCDDTNPRLGPAEPEICGDGIDQDCDGVDASCEDQDWDGDGYAPVEGDCDDGNPAIHPGAMDICGDGIDQNCNGSEAACRIPDADPASFAEFARTYAESLASENVDQYMTLFSPLAISNGSTPACFRAVQSWNFDRYDFSDVEYRVEGDPLIQEENGRTLATLTRTVRYTRISAGSGAETPVEDTAEAYFIREDDLWKVYGNQIGYQIPVLADFITSTGVDETTGAPINVTRRFTRMDRQIHMFFTVDNVVNGSMFTVRVLKPDGTVYSETPYEYNLGDYPNCVQSQTNWPQTVGIFRLGDIGIPGVPPDPGFGLETMGIWTVEVSLNGYGVLGYGNFEYLPLDTLLPET